MIDCCESSACECLTLQLKARWVKTQFAGFSDKQVTWRTVRIYFRCRLHRNQCWLVILICDPYFIHCQLTCHMVNLSQAWNRVRSWPPVRWCCAELTVLCRGGLFIDRVAGAIIRLVVSVCVCVRLSVGTLLFEPFDIDFWHEGRSWRWLAWDCRSSS